jgi:Domain of unknown function (DUF4830)/Domain of unknown function (DUF4829)
MKRLLIAIYLLLAVGYAGAPPATPSPDAVALLAKYNWTPAETLASFSVTLPVSFHDRSGDFPLGLYWAYSNEFSRAIGFDLAPYLGQSLTATIYQLKETLPPALFPYTSARAIILTSHGTIAGAWIDKAGYNASASTLDRRVFFTDLVSESWGEWLVASGVVSPTDALNQQLARLTPDEVIRAYYTAVDEQNFHLAYATLTQQALMEGYLFLNKPDSALFNTSYAATNWPANISEAKIQTVQGSPDGSVVEYEATVRMRFYKPEPSLHGNGLYGWFVILTKEIDGLGWRIQSIGSGP